MEASSRRTSTSIASIDAKVYTATNERASAERVRREIPTLRYLGRLPGCALHWCTTG